MERPPGTVGKQEKCTDEEFVDIFTGVTVNLSHPLLDIVEGFLVGTVIDQDDALCTPVVA